MADSQRPDLETEAADSHQNQTSDEEGASGTVLPDEDEFDTDENIPTPS